MQILPFQPKDATQTAQVIHTTLMTSNLGDYSLAHIQETIQALSPDALLQRAQWSHMYVVWDAGRIIGCGGISPFWGSLTESILLTIFVLPEYQGRGIGRQIVEFLEQDEYFLRARRIEIPASVTAVEFYRKLGYNYKNGILQPDEEQLYRLEKFR